MTSMSTQYVLAEVQAERHRQDAKWGEQNHPDGTGDAWEWQHGRGTGEAEDCADVARDRCQRWAARGKCTYALILEEEVAEAMAESEPAKLRAELIQVAAVAVAWVEKLDREAKVVVPSARHTRPATNDQEPNPCVTASAEPSTPSAWRSNPAPTTDAPTSKPPSPTTSRPS